MIPLKITAHLQCGVISDPALPLDAVLYYQVHREALGAQEVTMPGATVLQDGHHRVLPLKRVTTYTRQDARLWFYAASFAQWPDHTTAGTEHWNKRTDLSLIDLVDWRGRKARLDVAAGRYKSYHMPVYYRHALNVTWYVVGAADDIERLLRHVTHIGKKTAQGWGAILRWEVAPWPDDWSVWGPAGKLMRAIPEATSPTTYGLRPSYWLLKHQFPCRLP